MRTYVGCLGLGLAALWIGCGDDTSGEGGAPGTGGGATQTTTASTSGSNGSTVTSSSTNASSSTGDGGGGGCPVPDVTYEKGCLTFAGAGALCGFSSDDVICELAVMCGLTTDVDQCSINCEMGTTVECYDEADVECLAQAACASDCDALEACGFIL